jgi:ketosteroid isomerase-like protein
MMRTVKMVLAFALVFAGAASSTRADDGSELAAVRAAMQALDAAFENQDEATILSLVTPDHVAIAPVYGGSATVEEQFALFPAISYSAYDATEPAVAFLDPQTVITNYRISLKGTFRGNPLPSPVFVTEIWVKQDGKWLQRLYQETPTSIP